MSHTIIILLFREFVAANVPVKIQNGFIDWPALKYWNEQSLSRILGDSKVTVAVTPDGNIFYIFSYILLLFNTLLLPFIAVTMFVDCYFLYLMQC